MCVQIDQKTCLSETISGGRPTFNKAIKPKNSQEIVCLFKELNHPTHTHTHTLPVEKQGHLFHRLKPTNGVLA